MWEVIRAWQGLRRSEVDSSDVELRADFLVMDRLTEQQLNAALENYQGHRAEADAHIRAADSV